MIDPIFRSIDCVNTLDGFLFYWDIRTGLNVRRIDLHWSQNGKEWTLVQPDITGEQFLLPYGNQGLTAMFRLYGVCDNGEDSYSDIVQPVYIKREAVLVLKEIKRKTKVVMKANPFGTPPIYIFMRRYNGPLCPVCGNVCYDRGTDASCPVCFGTGIKDGYYLWPEPESMEQHTTKDDKTYNDPTTERIAVMMDFITAFSGRLREYDLLLVGNECYEIIKRAVLSSISGVPTLYKLSCVQLMPDEPRYAPLMNYIKQELHK